MDDAYQPQHLIERAAAAAVSAPLKLALQQLIPTLGPVLPALSSRQRLLSALYLEALVDELTAADAAVHWWQLHLHLILQASRPHGRLAQPLLAAADALQPPARAHVGPQTPVRLVEITAGTVRGICRLSDTLTDPQDLFVAPNAHSIAQAHFHPHAWFRAVAAGSTPVGFLLLDDNADESSYFLWRFMIAAPYQGRGYGRRAVALLADYVRTRPGAEALRVSCVPHPQGPLDFYVRCGFEPTGEEVHGEQVLKMTL